MILAAGAAIVLVLATMWAMSQRALRPPLRTGREDDLAAAEANGMIIVPRRMVSPIDRTVPVHDLDPIEGRKSETKAIGDGKVDDSAECSGDRAKRIGWAEAADWREIDEDDEAGRTADRTRREWR